MLKAWHDGIRSKDGTTAIQRVADAAFEKGKTEERERIENLLKLVGIVIHSDYVVVSGYAEKYPDREKRAEWDALSESK